MMTILHVDSDWRYYMELKGDIQTAVPGAKVHNTTKEDTARRLAAENDYDLIITDNQLAQGLGYQLVRKLRRIAKTQRTPIIGNSAHMNYNQKLCNAGASNTCLKRKRNDLLCIIKQYAESIEQKRKLTSKRTG